MSKFNSLEKMLNSLNKAERKILVAIATNRTGKPLSISDIKERTGLARNTISMWTKVLTLKGILKNLGDERKPLYTLADEYDSEESRRQIIVFGLMSELEPTLNYLSSDDIRSLLDRLRSSLSEGHGDEQDTTD